MNYADILPGVPYIDSPFFEEISAEKHFDEKTIEIASSLRENGFAIIDFPDPDFAHKADRIRDALSGNFDLDDWRENLWKNNQGLRIQDAWFSNEDVKSIAANQAIMDLLSKIYGKKAFPFQSLNFPVGTQQHMHSDHAHFSSVPERFMCGVWVALEDVDENNGTLEYWPKSHKIPSYINEHLGELSITNNSPIEHYKNYEELWKILMDKLNIKREFLTVKKGQALIWASNLIHGGTLHKDPTRTRWSQVTHYFFDECVYYTPMLSDPIFGSVHYREPMDISTGELKESKYSAHFVSEDVRSREKQMERILPADFNGSEYLNKNPDVQQAGINPIKHYLMHGIKEGRQW